MSSFKNLLERADATKAEIDTLRPFPEQLEERAMQKFRLWWTYHSNAIEGNTLTKGETEMFLLEGLTAKGKPLKDHLDIRGHSNAISYLVGIIRGEEVLTEAAIRKLHEILLIEPYQLQAVTPTGEPTVKNIAIGCYKTQPNHVRTPTGETHYYATPEETPAKMQELMEWYRKTSNKSDLHLIEIAATFHHRFTEIHPFDDGNGRMSRLLMNLILMQSGYPPVVIRIDERNEYLAALRRADAKEPNDFLIFIAEHVLSSLELFLRALRGEEIHEPSDLEKEITLLKMEFEHIEEPEQLSQARQQELYNGSFTQLVTEIVRLVAPLSELFAKSYVSLGGQYGSDRGNRNIKGKENLKNSAASLVPQDAWQDDFVINSQTVAFELVKFKKAGFETFDLSILLKFDFPLLKYTIEVPNLSPPIKIERFYQQGLSKDEIDEIARQIAKFFVDAIKKKTGITC